MNEIENAKYQLRRANERFHDAYNAAGFTLLGAGLMALVYGVASWFITGEWEELFQPSLEERITVIIVVMLVFYWLHRQKKNAEEVYNRHIDRDYL